MSKTRPFLIERGPGDGVRLAALDAEPPGAATRDPVTPPPRPAAQAAVTEDFRKLRRDRLFICTPRWKLYCWRNFVRDFSKQGNHGRIQSKRKLNPASQPQPSLFKSILGSHTSMDFISSSQVTSRPVLAAERAIM